MEHGTPGESPRPLEPETDAGSALGDLVVATAAACLGCGYPLRGLDRDSRCPECGHSVAESLMSRPWAGDVAAAMGEFRREFLLWGWSVGCCLTIFLACIAVPLYPVGRVLMLMAGDRWRQASQRLPERIPAGPANVVAALTAVGGLLDVASVVTVIGLNSWGLRVGPALITAVAVVTVLRTIAYAWSAAATARACGVPVGQTLVGAGILAAGTVAVAVWLVAATYARGVSGVLLIAAGAVAAGGWLMLVVGTERIRRRLLAMAGPPIAPVAKSPSSSL